MVVTKGDCFTASLLAAERLYVIDGLARISHGKIEKGCRFMA